MKRVLLFLITALLCIFAISGCGAERKTEAITESSVEAQNQSQSSESTFTYIHDPRENPLAMADIVENPDAVYGFAPDELFEKYGSWEEVLQNAFGTNMGMDACLGLYDEYYDLYIELGYVSQ